MQSRFRTRENQGFTLVELMVALSGGLFLSVMVFALARDTSRFYQRENRLAGATLAGMMGFERLKTDIARAGYLTTPNILKDPKICMNPAAGWPTALQNMGSVRIRPDFPAPNAALGPMGLTPDEIVLAGSYSVSESFPIRKPTGQDIVLQVAVPAMSRLGYNATGITAPEQTAILANVFRTGRVLRLIDDAGLQYFGVIASVVGGAQPTISLRPTPALVYGGGAQACGIQGDCTGCTVSVVNFIRYQIRDLKANGFTRFAPLWTASQGAPGEATRTELVREELDADGVFIDTPTDRTVELVAEYAVNLTFSVTAQVGAANNAIDVQPGDGNFTQIFDPTPANIGNPQRVRAVRVRLSVRSREADRESAITTGFYRFKLPDGDWARVRTFQADVALPNQADVRW